MPAQIPSKIRLLFKPGLELDMTVKYNVDARKVTLICSQPHPPADVAGV